MNVPVFLALLLLSCGYAGWRGGPPERAAAAILCGATLASLAAATIGFGGFRTVEAGLLAVDALTFVAMAALMLRANRYWPMAVTAFLAAGLLGHGAIMLSARIVPRVYATFHAFSAYPVLLILVAATVRHRRRLRSAGIDPPWSSASGWAGSAAPRR